MSLKKTEKTDQQEPEDKTVSVNKSDIFLSSEAAQNTTVQELREVLQYTHTIESLIGEGGMGVVYKVKNLGLDRFEAVKTFTHTVSDDELMRFQREARALSRIADGNVVSIYNVSVLPCGVPFILMEYVPGPSLAHILNTHAELNSYWSIYIFCLICYGLDTAHRARVIHRDIKPENVIIFQDEVGRDQAKLIDFGIARAQNKDSSDQFETRAGFNLGTPKYMSPEQFAGGPVTVQSDIYSLGCLLFAMLTGKPPYAAESMLELAQSHAQCEIPELPKHLRHLKPVFERSLAKKAADRYPDVPTMLDDVFRRHNSTWQRPSILLPLDRTNVITRPRKPLPELARYVQQFWLLSFLCVVFAAIACCNIAQAQIFATGALVLCACLWLALVYKVRTTYPKTLN